MLRSKQLLLLLRPDRDKGPHQPYLQNEDPCANRNHRRKRHPTAQVKLALRGLVRVELPQKVETKEIPKVLVAGRSNATGGSSRALRLRFAENPIPLDLKL